MCTSEVIIAIAASLLFIISYSIKHYSQECIIELKMCAIFYAVDWIKSMKTILWSKATRVTTEYWIEQNKMNEK